MRIDRKHTAKLLVYAMIGLGFQPFRAMLVRPGAIYMGENRSKRILTKIHFFRTLSNEDLDSFQRLSIKLQCDRSFLIIMRKPTAEQRQEAKIRGIRLIPLKRLKQRMEG